jgi:anti-sigma B factor antagonist
VGRLMISFSTEHQEQGVIVLSVMGEVDLHTGPELRSAVRATFADPETKQVRVDLSGVSFLDSTGVSALVAGHGEAQDRGITLVVANPQPQVQKVLRIVGLDKVLGVTSDTAGGD